jgi:hypothetical protein
MSYGRGRGIPSARPTGSRNLTLVNKHSGSTSVAEGDHPVNNHNSNNDSNNTSVLDKSLDASNIYNNMATTTGYIRRGNKLVRSDIGKIRSIKRICLFYTAI